MLIRIFLDFAKVIPALSAACFAGLAIKAIDPRKLKMNSRTAHRGIFDT